MNGGKAPYIAELSFRHSIEMCWSNGECSYVVFNRLFQAIFVISLQANAAILLQSRPQLLPFTHLPIYLHIILPIYTWFSSNSIGNDIGNS